ncbi:protein CUSTOS [Aplysia californica]|uniref:Protein CUSTOS n=1 Tax=Aplysia californica TaxID=6500 RepID=A0ABM0JE29_APLCA|nr:protein CUSTOS [Aplysia californica]XP_035829692.1 protein CUSTOS [Aplysia californica]
MTSLSLSSKSKCASDSSSESSEEDEESLKIQAAVCDDSLLELFKQKNQNYANPTTGSASAKSRTFSTSANGTDGRSTQTSVLSKLSLRTQNGNGTGIQKLHLPSNRPKDRNDEELDHVLKTTPEFRAHVAKKLSEVLEMQLADSVSDTVWVYTKAGHAKPTGIKLFSDSTRLSMGEDTPPPAPPLSHKVSPAVPRKHRLSTSSSESSDDDKIKACVFSVDDIRQENELLTRASLQGVEEKTSMVPAPSSQTDSFNSPKNAPETEVVPESSKKKKKKKLKKKRLKEEKKIK